MVYTAKFDVHHLFCGHGIFSVGACVLAHVDNEIMSILFTMMDAIALISLYRTIKYPLKYEIFACDIDPEYVKFPNEICGAVKKIETKIHEKKQRDEKEQEVIRKIMEKC